MPLDLQPIEEEKKEKLDLQPLDLQPIGDVKPTTGSFLSKAWNAISSPLTTKPSEEARSFADSIDNPLGEGSYGHGLMAGMAEGAGDLASSLTSPISLATMLLGGTEYAAGKAGLGALARAANIGTKIASAPVAAHGANTIYNSNNLKELLSGIIELAGGTAGMLHTPPAIPKEIPPVKPQLLLEEGKAPARFNVGPSGKAVESNAPIEMQAQAGDLSEPTYAPKPKGSVLDTTPLDLQPEPFYTKHELEGGTRLDIPDTELPRDITSGSTELGFNPESTGDLPYPLNVVPNSVRPRSVQGSIDLSLPNSFDETPIRPSTGIQQGDFTPDQPIELTQEPFNMGRPELPYELPSANRPIDLSRSVSDNSSISLQNPSPDNIARMESQGYIKGETLPDGSVTMYRKTGTGKELPRIPYNPKTSDVVSNPSMMGKVNSFAKTLLTSYDISAPGRQGLPLWNTKAFWTSLDDMFKAWGSENAYQAIQQGIRERPLFKLREQTVMKDGKPTAVRETTSFADEAGLDLTDVLSKREERFGSALAEKIPGVRRSERAYVGFLNKLRADHFETLVNSAEAAGLNPKQNMTLAKEIADFVNNATGRGSLGKLERHAKLLSDHLFAPRFYASRLRTLDPRYYKDASPFVRKQALKSLFGLAGASAAFMQLGKLAGADVNTEDSTSSTYGKLKFGDRTYLDPFAGFQQYVVLGSRLLNGLEDMYGEGNQEDYGKFGKSSPLDATMNFVMNKANPVQSFIIAMMRGTDFDQQPFEMKKAIINRIAPMMGQDLTELAKEDPNLLPLAIPAVLGSGLQTYGN